MSGLNAAIEMCRWLLSHGIEQFMAGFFTGCGLICFICGEYGLWFSNMLLLLFCLLSILL